MKPECWSKRADTRRSLSPVPCRQREFAVEPRCWRSKRIVGLKFCLGSARDASAELKQPLDNGCMQHIQRIDGELTKLFRDFEQIAQGLEFQPLGDLLQVDLKSIQFSGLYFLEVWSRPYGAAMLGDWLACFTSKWNQEEFKQSFVPSCQKGRMAKHTAVQEWMPLYLGKSENIGKRVSEHLYLTADKRTFALKLKARNLLEGNRYRLSVLRLEVVNYPVLAPKIEAAMRKKHLPLVGRQ